ncbi:DUF2884 family protein [Alteromonas oceanisediminis]|uniref:DUF2884 family protein n=1 Tax=Alteromonas oceanisediminis TaxID=2836180 RepID=UPI001BD99D1D|nr:DUF2884 family protein [Alteromonas oceanisediminis]MBT0585874.1 DUF2884 family protein [Alteromonas oceanisediminis]
MMQRHTGITTIALAAALLSAPIHAHVAHNEHCNINLDGSLDHQQGQLSIDSDSLNATFNASGDVLVDGQPLKLTDAQQEAAQAYYRNIVSAVPMTVSIATDAITIAGTTVSEVFTELLGEDEDLSQEFDVFFADLQQRIDSRYDNANGDFTIHASDLGHGDWIDQGWDEEFDAKVENLVSQSLGKILLSVGGDLFSGDQSIADFANRMSNFGETIEERVNERAQSLEKQADILCDILYQADVAETELSQQVSALSSLDILTVNRNHAK